MFIGFILFSNISYSQNKITTKEVDNRQNVLHLKNGDKIIGKFEGYKKDTIIFNLQGNKLKFSSKDVTAIYFDTNSIELNRPDSKREGKINGVITYYFNKNYGDKPDVGAEIFIVDSSMVKGFDIKLLDTFYYGNSYRRMYLYYKSMKIDVPIDIMNEVKKYNVENKSSFDSLDHRVLISILGKIEISKYVKKIVVDGSGNYSLNVLPGTYYVCINSNNRKGFNLTEASGKVRCFKVFVKNGEDTNVSYNFDID